MKRTMVGLAIVALACTPAFADHEDEDGYETCEYAHDDPHYGLRRHDPTDPTSWPSQGDPADPWVGSTSPTGAVYAGRFGGSEGNAWLSAGSCLEYQGAGSHGGTSEANVYEDDGEYQVVVVAEGGNDDAGANSYVGLNTGYQGRNGGANGGGPLCAGQRSGANACTPQEVPGVFMCEPASNAGGPSPSQGGGNWHRSSEDGCDLRTP